MGKAFTVAPLKTAASRRTLPLPAVCVAALKSYRARQLRQRLKAGPDWQNTGFVFTILRRGAGRRLGTPLHPRDVLRLLHDLLTIAAVVALVVLAYSVVAPWKAVALWCGVIACVSALRAWLLPSSRSEVSSTIFQVAALLTTYATAVYPTFAPAWGGGAPVHASLEIRDNGRTRVEEVMIIDETPNGFYIRTDNGESTLFLPRASVASLLIPRQRRPAPP